MDKNKNIRIKDIAKMAGVSAGTVDRVIHNRGNVSEKVEKEIKAILEKTGYTPNPIAQSLGTAKDYQISVMIPSPEQDEYWALSDIGINQAREEWKSYNLHIDLNRFDLYDSESFSEISEKVLQARPDAVLTAPVFYDESLIFFQKLQALNIPCVLFNTQIKEYDPLCFIGQDLYQSGRVAAELMHITLQESGKIAVMHIHENIDNSIHLKEKERGFRDYCDEIDGFEYEICSFSFLDDYESFESQIGRCIDDIDLKGIFITTSSGTFTTAQALINHGMHIPLIGYDLLKKNIHYLKKGTISFLINQNPSRQTFQGLRYLVNHLLLNLKVPQEDLLPLQVITRENYASFLSNKH